MEIYKHTDRRSGIKPIVRHLRLKARIKEEVKTAGRVVYNGEFLHYTTKIQVKILGIWVTVWAETCDYSDGDTRSYIKNCAEEVHQALTEKV